MDKINFQNGVTKVNADTFKTFQNNIEKSAVVVSPTQPTTNEKVWFKKGKNLFNKDDFISRESYIDGSNGKITSFLGHTKLLIVEIAGGQDYTISKMVSQIFRVGTTSEFPADGVTVNNLKINNTGTSITISAGKSEKYLVCYYYNADYESLSTSEIEATIQIEANSTATPYESYIKPTVLVKNGSIFEEFILKNEKKYSVTEQAIGTWIDGKTVYRKIIEATSPVVADTNTNIYNISDLNIKEVIKIEGTVYNKGSRSRGSINSYISADDYVTTWLYCEDTNKPSHIRCRCRNRTNSPMEIILEYTKN